MWCLLLRSWASPGPGLYVRGRLCLDSFSLVLIVGGYPRSFGFCLVLCYVLRLDFAWKWATLWLAFEMFCSPFVLFAHMCGQIYVFFRQTFLVLICMWYSGSFVAL